MFDNQYLYKTFIQTGLNSTSSFEDINGLIREQVN